ETAPPPATRTAALIPAAVTTRALRFLPRSGIGPRACGRVAAAAAPAAEAAGGGTGWGTGGAPGEAAPAETTAGAGHRTDPVDLGIHTYRGRGHGLGRTSRWGPGHRHAVPGRDVAGGDGGELCGRGVHHGGLRGRGLHLQRPR